LLGKLAEDDFSKLDRLITLRFDYARRVALAESAAFAYGGRDTEGGSDDEEDLEEKAYLARSEAGLYTLQLLDSVVCYVAVAKSKPLRARALQRIYEGGASLHDAWGNAEELLKTVYAADAGLGGGGEAGCGADTAQRRAMAEMEEGVNALLAKYQAPAQGGGEGLSAPGENGEGHEFGGGDDTAEGEASALPPPGV
jgi:hypothetical protein